MAAILSVYFYFYKPYSYNGLPYPLAMEITRSAFGERLFKARSHAGLSQVELARRVGMSQSAYAQAERGGKGSSLTVELAAACGVRATWLATGKGPMLEPDGGAGEVDLDSHPELSPIRTVKLKLQAGVSGFAVEPDTDDDGPPLFYRNDWLQKRGYKPYNLIVLRVAGMSMVDKLWPDDRVVVNTADTTPKDGEVFVINFEGETIVKRLIRDKGKWWITSDNPDKTRYPDKEWSDDSCILIGHIVQRMTERV